jgi:hypothetical protein
MAFRLHSHGPSGLPSASHALHANCVMRWRTPLSFLAVRKRLPFTCPVPASGTA